MAYLFHDAFRRRYFPPAAIRGASRAVNLERGNHVSPSDPLLWGERCTAAFQQGGVIRICSGYRRKVGVWLT